MQLKEEKCLQNLLYIKDLRPAFIAFPLAVLHLLIDIDEKIKFALRLFLGISGSSAPALLGFCPLIIRWKFHFPCDPFPDILFGIAFAKRAESDKALLPRTTDPDMFPGFHLISGFP